jgi:hypothetical protein
MRHKQNIWTPFTFTMVNSEAGNLELAGHLSIYKRGFTTAALQPGALHTPSTSQPRSNRAQTSLLCYRSTAAFSVHQALSLNHFPKLLKTTMSNGMQNVNTQQASQQGPAYNHQPPADTSHSAPNTSSTFHRLVIFARCDANQTGQINDAPFWLTAEECHYHVKNVKDFVAQWKEFATFIVKHDASTPSLSQEDLLALRDELLSKLYDRLLAQQQYSPKPALKSNRQELVSTVGILNHLESQVRKEFQSREQADPQGFEVYSARNQAQKDQVDLFEAQTYRLAVHALNAFFNTTQSEADVISDANELLDAGLADLMKWTGHKVNSQYMGNTSVDNIFHYSDIHKNIVAALLRMEVEKQPNLPMARKVALMKNQVDIMKGRLHAINADGKFSGDAIFHKTFYHLDNIRRECTLMTEQLQRQLQRTSANAGQEASAPVANGAGKRRRDQDEDTGPVEYPPQSKRTRHVAPDPVMPRNVGVAGSSSHLAAPSGSRRSSKSAAQGQRSERLRPKATSGLAGATYQQTTVPPPPPPVAQAPVYQPAPGPTTNVATPAVTVDGLGHACNYVQLQAYSHPTKGLQQNESGCAYVDVSNLPGIPNDILGLGVNGAPFFPPIAANQAQTTQVPQVQPDVAEQADTQQLNTSAFADLLGITPISPVGKCNFEEFQQVDAGEQPSNNQAGPRPKKAPRNRRSQSGSEGTALFSPQKSNVGAYMPIDPQLQPNNATFAPPAEYDNVTEQLNFRDSGYVSDYKPPSQTDDNGNWTANAGPKVQPHHVQPGNAFDEGIEGFNDCVQQPQNDQYHQNGHYQQDRPYEQSNPVFNGTEHNTVQQNPVNNIDWTSWDETQRARGNPIMPRICLDDELAPLPELPALPQLSEKQDFLANFFTDILNMEPDDLTGDLFEGDLNNELRGIDSNGEALIAPRLGENAAQASTEPMARQARTETVDEEL